VPVAAGAALRRALHCEEAYREQWAQINHLAFVNDVHLVCPGVIVVSGARFG
jgi:hypothetical protein